MTPSFKPKKPTERLVVGAHTVEISGFEYQKEGGSIIYMPGTNNPKAITVTFKSVVSGITRRKNFSLAENTIWVLENLSNAIGIDLVGDDEYDVETEVIGKRLVIIVCRVYMTIGGIVKVENGRQVSYDDISTYFYKEEDILLIKGDPGANPPTGDFVKYREEWKVK